jgi:hypothetical protein
MFVYDPSGAPTWYTAAMNAHVSPGRVISMRRAGPGLGPYHSTPRALPGPRSAR